MTDTTKTPDPITEGTTFENALRAVSPHLAKNTDVPVLTGVNMVGDRLYATDRYTMGVARFNESPATAENELWLSPQLIRLILAHKDDPLIELLPYGGNRMRAEFESGIIYDLPVSGHKDIVVGKFPNLKQITEGWVPAESGRLNFNGEFTKKFSNTHIKGDPRAPLAFEPGKSSDSPTQNPVFRVRRTGLDWFVGYVVEIRVS